MLVPTRLTAVELKMQERNVIRENRAPSLLSNVNSVVNSSRANFAEEN